MENLTIGVHMAAAGTVELVDRVVEAEQLGVEVAWLTVGGLAPDPVRRVRRSGGAHTADQSSGPRSCRPSRAIPWPWRRGRCPWISSRREGFGSASGPQP